MQTEIKKIFSLDIDDLKGYVPDNPDSFSISLRLIIGPRGQIGEESFDIVVCTPQWLFDKYKNTDVVFLLRHTLLVTCFDYKKIITFIENYVHGCNGQTWQEISEKLSRFGQWEFEDYRQ